MIDSDVLDFGNAPGSERQAEFGYVAAEPVGEPHVSIVTVFHDQASALARTAPSVFGQSFQYWEWLIVPDGSALDTASMAELARLRSVDPRVRVVDHGQCRGVAAARNMAIQLARGALIAQLDAGDMLEPTAIEKWAWFLESHSNLSFVGADRTGLEADSSRSDKGIAAWPPDLDDQLGISSGLVRAGVYQAVGGYTEASAPAWTEWEFRLRCASGGYWGGTVPEQLSWHADTLERQPLDDLRSRYQDLWNRPAAVIQQSTDWPAACLREDVPFANVLGKDRPRLLLIGPMLTVGGAEMFNLDLTRFAQRLGWDVTIATTMGDQTDWISEFERLTSDLFVLPRFLRPEDFPRFVRYLVVSRQIDVVVLTQSEFAYTLLPYIRRHCADVALIDVCHIETDGWRGGGFPGLAIASQPLLDLNLVTTSHLKGWMVERGAEASRITVCHTNVDVEEWRPDAETRTKVRADLGIAAWQPVLLYAARICPQKQPMVFARTVCELRERGRQVTALVVGDGPDLPELEAFLVRENLMSSVRLLGRASSSALKQLMQAADIFFLPSEWEGISIAVYEAMACGMAVVTADVGGQSELVTPDCGILVAPSSPESEAQEYARVLGELIDHPEERARMSANARERVRASFRLDQMGEHLAEALQRAPILHAEQPRAVPSAAESTLSAVRAVDGATYETKLRAMEAGKAWLAEQSTRWHLVADQQNEMLTEMHQWVSRLQEANAWLTEQAASWEKATREQAASWEKATREQQLTLQEQDTWVSSLRESNAWLTEQCAAWEKMAHEQAQTIQELRDFQLSSQPAQQDNDPPTGALRWGTLILRRLSSWVGARP